MKIYMSATDTTGIQSINISNSHTAQSALAQIEAIQTDLDIGSSVEIELGYDTGHSKVFTGYVKYIEIKEPTKLYNITCSDVLVRAMDFFIASSTPDNPFTRNHIKAEDLVKDVLGLARLTNYVGDNTLFTFGINNPVEVNLTTSYDYSRFIGDILAYNVYADVNGQVHFTRRLPYIVPGDTPVGTITVNDSVSMSFSKTDKDLRNRIVVYGMDTVHGEASASSPYLPDGFYKSVVVAAPTVFDNNAMAQQAADYNLELLNRLTQSVSIVMIGNPMYLARTIARVENTSLGISDIGYVYSANHAASSAGYTTSLEVHF
jgi:hypothetical protein